MEYKKNPLYKKTIVFDGDSICQGNPKQGRLPWGNLIGEKNEMEWYNYGIGGGTVTAELYSNSDDGTKKPRHWVSRNIDKIHELHPSLDYLILEGGTNDADLLASSPERIGSLDPSDYSGNYDDSTFTGALESLFFKATSYYPTARIGFIVAHKMGLPPHAERRRTYFLRAIEVCKKWVIPYIDLWERTPLNPSLKCYYDASLSSDENIALGKAYCDGQHLTPVGYGLITPAIESFIASL